MSKDIYIMPKDEAYSFHELSYIKDNIMEDNLLKKISALCNAIEFPDKSAVFFMPDNGFMLNIFNIQSICEINKEDILGFIKTVENSKDTYGIKAHILNKLKTLYNFLNSNNRVNPTVISVDNLSLKSV